METAQSLINDALFELQINEAEQSVEAVDFETAKRYLNRMMAQFDADGISLGYTEVNNAADPITVAPGAINGMIYNLAIRLANQYNVAVTEALAANAKLGLDTMRKLSVFVTATPYPGTLPIGSGNEWDSGRYNTFYPEENEAVTTETGRYIQLEDNTDV